MAETQVLHEFAVRLPPFRRRRCHRRRREEGRLLLPAGNGGSDISRGGSDHVVQVLPRQIINVASVMDLKTWEFDGKVVC